jgi:glycosyltransferase involved in cell wall biosynthesis
MAWEQLRLPRLAKPCDVLVNGANFAPLRPRTAPSILIAHNALYFDAFTSTGVRGTRYRLEGKMARQSVRCSHRTITPSSTMAELVRASTGVQAQPIHFGPGLVQSRAPTGENRFVFLHRTSWGPHKRLDELLLAVRLLAERYRGRFVVRTGCDPGSPFARSHSESASQRAFLGNPLVNQHVEFASFAIGSAEHRQLRGDAIVMPSTLESFCFPLAEGIATGMPMVAADMPYARELCGRAAIYAAPTDPAALAAAMERLLEGDAPPPPTDDARRRISWETHVDRLAAACRSAVDQDVRSVPVRAALQPNDSSRSASRST